MNLPEIYVKFLVTQKLSSVRPQFHPMGELGDMERNFQAPSHPSHLLAANGLGNSTNEG